jgi:hypothetical protein
MRRFSFRAVSRSLTVALSWTFVLGNVAGQPTSPPANELVKLTVEKEAKVDDQTMKFMFKQRKETPGGSQTRLMVQTREAMAGMTVANNDHPLSPEQRQGEFGRVERFISEPEELQRKARKEKEDSERVQRILRALPEAFLYEYDGTETGWPGVGRPGEPLVRLKFRPNPKYDPPSRVEQVLTGMQGLVLIDPKQQHIARIDGTLIRDVGFVWGILGHLDKGGHFLVDQSDVMQNNWAITRMELSFTGKLLLFKSLLLKSTEVFSDFRPVPPNLTFAQGVQLLKKQANQVAENQPQVGSGK